MQQEILKIIESNLPAQTAGEMKRFIENAEQVQADLKGAEGLIEKQRKIIVDFEKQEEKFKQLETWETNLKGQAQGNEQRCFELDSRERQFELEKYAEKVALIDEYTNNLYKLVDKVMGHPATSIRKQVPIDMGSYNNGSGETASGESLQDTTETTTESKE